MAAILAMLALTWFLDTDVGALKAIQAMYDKVTNPRTLSPRQTPNQRLDPNTEPPKAYTLMPKAESLKPYV